jgi:hypothetical protein
MKTLTRYFVSSFLAGAIFGFLLFEGYLPFFSKAALAQVQDVNTQTVSGEVTSMTPNGMTIKSGNDVKEVTISNGAVSVKRDNEAVSLNQIQVNDNVTVTYNSTGQVIMVEAKTPQAMDANRTMILVGIVGLIALLIAFTLWKKSQQGKIRTTVEQQYA